MAAPRTQARHASAARSRTRSTARPAARSIRAAPRSCRASATRRCRRPLGSRRTGARSAASSTVDGRAPMPTSSRSSTCASISRSARGFLRRIVGQVRAVDGVSFHIRKGETLALVGESGCGKTTVSRCILRALRADLRRRSASRSTARRSTSRRCRSASCKPLRRHMQMIFQDPFSSLNPRMMIADIIGEPLLVNGMRSAAERRERVARAARPGAAAARLHATASRTPSAAASASASASRARWRSTRA